MDSPRLPSPSRYNPKVEERKMRAETDWAKLVRHQQALAEKMIQQERDMRMLQRMELKDSLTNMATEKKNTQTREYQQAKQEAFVEIKEREKDFNEYHNKLKNDKNEFQKLISDEYSREKWMREEEQRRRMEQEKRMDQQTIKNALDSLEKEKMLKERQKSEFIQGVDQLMRERELQRMREKEQAHLNRQEHNELVNQAIQNVDMKDLNYKLYYQKLMEKQYNRQQIHDQRVHQSVLNKEKQIESFVEQNVREEQRRKEEEERRRQQFRQQQLQDVTHNIKTKIYEHQEEKFREKAAYQEKVDELMRQNQESQNLNSELKMLKNIQALDYKNTLAYQMKEQQEVKRKFDSDMSEHEKAMHLNNFGARLIPGVKNTMNDLLNFPTIKSKTVERMKVDAVTSPYGSPSKAGKSFMLPNDADSPTRGVGNMSMYSPTSPNAFNKTDAYNPITNPLPNFNQNPYIQKEPKNDSPQRRLRNILATTAEANLGNGGRIGF